MPNCSAATPRTAELVQRHLGPVYAVALRKVGGRTHLAQDVAQAVFTELARNARPLSRHVALTGWLFRSAHFIAAKTLRAERRRQSREQEAYLMHEPTTGPTTDIDWESLRPLLDDLINELNEGDRRALLLRFFEGCTLGQIGTRLNLTERGAQAKVQRALDKLSVRLARRGVKSTEAALAVALATQSAVAVPAGLAATVAGAALTVAAGGGAALTFLAFMNSKTIAACAIILLIGTGVIVERQFSGQKPASSTVNSSNAFPERLKLTKATTVAPETPETVNDSTLLFYSADDMQRAKNAFAAASSEGKADWAEFT
jgi:RNA polymerase sigma factor (sigma-70 family)